MDEWRALSNDCLLVWLNLEATLQNFKTGWSKLVEWFFDNYDLIVILLLGVIVWLLIGRRDERLGSPDIAAIAGAIIGGMALLGGNWINRLNERFKSKKEAERKTAVDENNRREELNNIVALMAAELVDVAAGLLTTKRYVDAAVISHGAGGPVGPVAASHIFKVRSMHFTEQLGAKLLLLDIRAIDAVATLRSNLAVTQSTFDESLTGQFTLFQALKVSGSVGHTMEVLADCFDRIAPTRRLQETGKPPELAAELMRRSAPVPQYGPTP